VTTTIYQVSGGLDPESDDDEIDAIIWTLQPYSTISRSEYFDEYEFNDKYRNPIHNKSNVTTKMSKEISDMLAAAESLSSLSFTKSGQIYSESTSKEKASHDISTDNGIYVKGFLSMGKDDLNNTGTTPAFSFATL